MNDETYLQDLFINEAKPALQRHSGGGGGGSDDLVDCESLPTSNVKEGKIYRSQTTVVEGDKTIEYVTIGIPETDADDRHVSVKRYADGEWYQPGLIKTLIESSDPPACFQYCNVAGSFDTLIRYNDTSKLTSMSNLFQYCTRLTSVPLLDTRNVTTMYQMFYYCKALTTVPLFDTRNVKDMYWMFYQCNALTTVPAFDTRNVTTMYNMFYQCYNLTECRLRNIKTNLIVGSSASYGYRLTVDSLVHLIYELRDTGSSKTLTVGSENLKKLANVYVKTVEVTDEMRAEDDLVDEKLPFVVCESTDEGACLITEYANYKHWQIA